MYPTLTFPPPMCCIFFLFYPLNFLSSCFFLTYILISGVLDGAEERSCHDHVLVAHIVAYHDGMLVLLLGPPYRVGGNGEGDHAHKFLDGVQEHSDTL